MHDIPIWLFLILFMAFSTFRYWKKCLLPATLVVVLGIPSLILLIPLGVFVGGMVSEAITPSLHSDAVKRSEAKQEEIRQNYRPSPEVNQMLNTQSTARSVQEQWSDGKWHTLDVPPDHLELGKPLPKPTPTPQPHSNPQPRGKTTFALS
jgi:hypothetical protein